MAFLRHRCEWNIYPSWTYFQLTGIATTGAHQTTYGGGNYDAFLVKFNSSGVRQWGTYYGGTGDDMAIPVLQMPVGIFISSVELRIQPRNCHNRCSPNTYGEGISDAFLVKFNSSGVRQWGTYYGGTGDDMAIPALQMPVGIFISQGVLIQLTELPQQVLTKPHMEGDYDAFLVKFNSSGVRQWGTYYGGTGEIWLFLRYRCQWEYLSLWVY